MRELIRLGQLLDQAKFAITADEVQKALVALVEYLYRKEYDRERGIR